MVSKWALRILPWPQSSCGYHLLSLCSGIHITPTSLKLFYMLESWKQNKFCKNGTSVHIYFIFTTILLQNIGSFGVKHGRWSSPCRVHTDLITVCSRSSVFCTGLPASPGGCRRTKSATCLRESKSYDWIGKLTEDCSQAHPIYNSYPVVSNRNIPL